MNEKTLSRVKRLEKLKEWFCENLSEDPIDGTDFDCAVLNALNGLEAVYAKEMESPYCGKERIPPSNIDNEYRARID